MIPRLFIASVLFASFSVSASEWPADPDADPCDAGSARGQGECAQRQLDQQTDEMLAVYAQLIASLPQDHDDYVAKSQLVKAQGAWADYRDTTCLFEGGITGGVIIWQSARAVRCEVSATERRTATLRAYLACVKEEAEASCEEFL